MAGKKLWQLLVDRGIFKDKKEATGWIMMGKVYINNQRIDKSGEKVPVDSEIYVKGLEKKYVSKGGLKLEGAIKDFAVNVKDKIAIDSGASTGGFTDCLLQHGAKLVYAVDVGYGQLTGKLRNDQRVVNMEKVNIGEVKPEELDPVPELATADLSYLSLKKAIPIFRDLINDTGEIICLVKPLFEVDDSEMRRKGKIDNPEIFKEILSELVNFIESENINPVGITNSPVTGNNGTKEFFMYITKSKSIQPEKNIFEQINESIKKVMRLEDYKKD